MFSMIGAGRNRILVGICLLALSGCSSLSQRLPSCDGSARRPLNGAMYGPTVDSRPEMAGLKYPSAVESMDSLAKATSARAPNSRISTSANPVIPAAFSSSQRAPVQRVTLPSANEARPMAVAVPSSLGPRPTGTVSGVAVEAAALGFAGTMAREKPVSIRTFENCGDKS